MYYTMILTVGGMTCQHCAAWVTEELQAVPGVADVAVDLPSGAVTVTGDPDGDAVRAAVVAAGYEVLAS